MLVVHRRFVGKVLVKTICTAATNYLVVAVQAPCSVSTRGLVLMSNKELDVQSIGVS